MPTIPGNVATSPLLDEVRAHLGSSQSGKVRETFDLGDGYLLMVATDRISAFDVVLSDLIDRKGEVLTAMTVFWLRTVAEGIRHHLVAYGSGIDGYLPEPLRGNRMLQKTALVVRKLRPVMIECIGRYVLTGSGFSDYKKKGTVCGIELPPGLHDGDIIPDGPIFTPSTKADIGHDENITGVEAASIAGVDVAEECAVLTLQLLSAANELAQQSGIVVADTKFEFGLDGRGRLVLIDEVLTPDSSRFMSDVERLSAIEKGKTPPSMDKQYVRNYLLGVGFREMPPEQQAQISLPSNVREATTGMYVMAFLNLVGKGLDVFQAEDMNIAE